MKAKSEHPYTNKELRQPQPQWPDRGLECPKCHTVIPQFADLTSEQLSRLHSLVMSDQKMMAVSELEALTGAPTRWAKIWVTHGGRPDVFGTTGPCPYCGQPLKTARAKQCPHCFMDWHDAANPKSLKEEPNQPVQRNASTGFVSSLESPARRG